MHPADDEQPSTGWPARDAARRPSSSSESPRIPSQPGDQAPTDPPSTYPYPAVPVPPTPPTEYHPTVPRHSSGPSWMVGTTSYDPRGTSPTSGAPRSESWGSEPQRSESWMPEPRGAAPTSGAPRTDPQRAEPWSADPQRAEPWSAEPWSAEPPATAGWGTEQVSAPRTGRGSHRASGNSYESVRDSTGTGPGAGSGSSFSTPAASVSPMSGPPTSGGPTTGTVYSTGRLPTSRRARPDHQKRDWLIVGAIGFLVVAVLVGAGFVIVGMSSDGAPQAAAVASGGPTGAVAPAPEPTSAAAPTPDPTPSAPPTTTAAAPAGTVVRTALTGLCTAVTPGVDPEGAPVLSTTCDSQPDQVWTATPVQNPPTSYYLVNNASGKCLDIWAAGQQDGAVAVQWSCHGAANQQWRMQPNGNGFLIINMNSNKCLSVKDNNPAPNTPLHQWDCVGVPAQTWSFS